MKKLVVLISVSLAFVFSSCNFLGDLDPSDKDNVARYRILIKNTDEWAKVLYLTVSADPPTKYIDTEVGGVAQDGGTGSYDFELPLDVYKGKTIYVKLYTGPNYKEAKFKQVKEIVVDGIEYRSVLHFRF